MAHHWVDCCTQQIFICPTIEGSAPEFVEMGHHDRAVAQSIVQPDRAWDATDDGHVFDLRLFGDAFENIRGISSKDAKRVGISQLSTAIHGRGIADSTAVNC